MSEEVLLAVNGTLMRGLKLNPNMAAAKATFLGRGGDWPAYHLWSIWDDHPAGARRGRKRREPHRDRSKGLLPIELAFAVCFRNGRS